MSATLNTRIADHYTRGNLAQALLDGLARTGLDLQKLGVDDLAPADEFHIGGRRGTEAFAARFCPPRGAHLLDVGSGIGGPSRFFAQAFDCHVTGVDLTPEYVEVAGMLAGLVDMRDRVDYHVCDATRLGFASQVFDGAYMMHVGMNIPDKAAVFAEMRRVVKPGGAIGIYEVLRGPGEDPIYPAPWAADADASFLVTPDEMRGLLTGAGFRIESEEDRTRFGIGFFEEMAAKNSGGPPSFGMHLLMGESGPVKVANMVQNVREGRCAPWTFICR